jgi:predicted ATPase
MIANASKVSQVIVVSHANSLTESLTNQGAISLGLQKEEGETIVSDIEIPPWKWPQR